MADSAKPETKNAIINNFFQLKFYKKKKDWKLATEKEAEEHEKELAKMNNDIYESTIQQVEVESDNEMEAEDDTLQNQNIQINHNIIYSSLCEATSAPLPSLPPLPHSYTLRLPAPVVYQHRQYLATMDGEYEEFARGAALARHSSEYDLT